MSASRSLLALSLFFASPVFAFPELARFGYGNCITCHYSPSGGGLLTEYGRALSREILSNAGGETEGEFLYGLVTPPKELAFGGDVRALQTVQALESRSTLRFILMQADAEAGVIAGPVTVVGTAGLDYGQSFISRRHYALVHASDNIALRAGRFMPSFGIYTENHAIGVKRGLGKDQATETYNVEASWIGETVDAFLTGIIGRPDNPSLGAEAGVAATSSVFVGNSYKIGASYYYGSRDLDDRHVFGPFGILGFTPQFFLLVETDFQVFAPKTIPAVNQTGFVDDIRLDYEIFKGFHVYLTQEYGIMDFGNPNTMEDTYGLGVQFFPRPHLELNVLYQRQRFGGSSQPFGDFAFALFHVYL